MKQTQMETTRKFTGSYLLHIYRHEARGLESLVGTLEKLGNGEKETFHNIGELLALLGMADRCAGSGGKD